MSPAFDRLEALPDTRRVERPRLVSRPMPQAWKVVGARREVMHTASELVFEGPRGLSADDLDKLDALARDLLALVAWERHERAVRAQEGGR